VTILLYGRFLAKRDAYLEREFAEEGRVSRLCWDLFYALGVEADLFEEGVKGRSVALDVSALTGTYRFV
jgi:hypothetical protein